LAFLGDAYSAAGQANLAKLAFDEALEVANSTGERWAEAEIRRLSGRSLARGRKRPPAEAIVQFEQAIALAQQQESRSFELRATTNLVHVLADKNASTKWHKSLSNVYRSFTEGFGTPDLTEAKAALAHAVN
jgi:predicted ATPase